MKLPIDVNNENTWRDQNLWILIPTLPVAITALGIALHVSQVYLAVFGLELLVWTWYIRQYGPSPAAFPEYAFLRNTRIKLAFAGLLFYSTLNVILLSISLPIALAFNVLYPIRASILSLIYQVLMQSDKREVGPINNAEDNAFIEMCLKNGGSVIYLTWAMFFVDLLLTPEYIQDHISLTSPQETILFVLLLVISVIGIIFYTERAYTRETESREYAYSLAQSLKKRRWKQMLERKKSGVIGKDKGTKKKKK